MLTGNILTQRVSPWGVGDTKAKTPSVPFGPAEWRNRHVNEWDTAVGRGVSRTWPGLWGRGGP